MLRKSMERKKVYRRKAFPGNRRFISGIYAGLWLTKNGFATDLHGLNSGFARIFFREQQEKSCLSFPLFVALSVKIAFQIRENPWQGRSKFF